MFNAVILLIFTAISIYISICDIKSYHIPLLPAYIGLFISILAYILFSKTKLPEHLLGMLLMPLFFFFMRLITKGGMGLGDIQYAIYCGFLSGFPTFLFSSLFSSIIGILIFLFFIKTKSKRIPFIPAMFLGTVIAILIPQI